MKQIRLTVLLVIASSSGAACTQEAEGDDAIPGFAAQAHLAPNAMIPNAMIPNALNPALLVTNALRPSSLSSVALAALQDPGPAGDLSRQHLLYAVGCAFDPTQSFSFSWTDSGGIIRNEVYWGILGLVPTWASKQLNSSGQRYITACLAARVNRYGMTVNLSLRGPTGGLSLTSEEERAAFPRLEGAFWGNIYTATPSVHACHSTPDDENSRSHHRDCATGQLDANGTLVPCGIIQLAGDCSTACTTMNATNQFWSACGSPINPSVVTSALP